MKKKISKEANQEKILAKDFLKFIENSKSKNKVLQILNNNNKI